MTELMVSPYAKFGTNWTVPVSLLRVPLLDAVIL